MFKIDSCECKLPIVYNSIHNLFPKLNVTEEYALETMNQQEIYYFSVNFSISSWRSCAETNSTVFGDMMKLAMRELKDLLDNNVL
jgi:hypothetical protein